MRERLTQLFAHDRVAGLSVRWQPTGDRTAVAEIDLGRQGPVAIVDLREDITRGQVVARYTVEGRGDLGDWRPLSQGTTIGYRKLDRFAPVAVRYVRLRIEDAQAQPTNLRMRLY
jgi:alpha-L-fucosidase